MTRPAAVLNHGNARVFTIVVVKVEERQEGRVYAGRPWGPQTTVIDARAAVWLRRGGEFDIARANAWADTEGYRVFTFPTDERDPLGRAKALATADRGVAL